MAVYNYKNPDSPKPVKGNKYIALIVVKRPECENKECVLEYTSSDLGYSCYFPDFGATWWVDEMKDIEEDKPVLLEMIIVDHTNKHLVKKGDCCINLDKGEFTNMYSVIKKMDSSDMPFLVNIELINKNPITGVETTCNLENWCRQVGIYKTEQQIKIDNIKESVKELLKGTALTEKQINSIISKIK